MCSSSQFDGPQFPPLAVFEEYRPDVAPRPSSSTIDGVLPPLASPFESLPSESDFPSESSFPLGPFLRCHSLFRYSLLTLYLYRLPLFLPRLFFTGWSRRCVLGGFGGCGLELACDTLAVQTSIWSFYLYGRPISDPRRFPFRQVLHCSPFFIRAGSRAV